MPITREYLDAQIKDLLAQEANHLALANSAHGAVDAMRHLLAVIDADKAASAQVAPTESPSISIGDFRKMIGADGATIEPVGASHE